VVLAVAVSGIPINLLAARILARGHGDARDGEARDGDARHGETRSLNLEGSYRHILTDLYGFIATAIAGGVVLATGFARADAIASLLIAALMLQAAYGLLKASGRVFMEDAPAGVDPNEIGQALASEPGVVEVHDLHVWEVSSGFPALSAHVLVAEDRNCHTARRQLEAMLHERFELEHTTLQVDHEGGDLLEIETLEREHRD
jgi:cobalt-zinc-cadmium efflux system protein